MTWKELITEQVKWTRERSHWYLIWLGRLSVSVSQLCGHWRRISSFPGRFCEYCVAPSSTSAGFCLKGAWRSRSRPPRPSSVRRSGAACFQAMCFKIPPSEMMKVYPPVKLKVFLDDITAFVEGRNKGLAEKVVGR